MKIKSFSAGLARGIAGAMEILDRMVAEQLGSTVTIHSVKDTYYDEDQTKFETATPCSGLMTRVVVYSDR